MTEPVYTGRATDFYVAPDGVAEVVNLAIDLQRPLLVEGEPGCGKTMLAYSIAAEKQVGAPIKIMVKSTSRAQDLLYRFDGFRRLQDAQSPQNVQAQRMYPYLSLNPLGEAINQRRRCVVLIDEIDKADIDFPNDLLDVLDTFSFDIPDLPAEEEEECRRVKGFGRHVALGATTPGELVHPIVVITSNREKRLPEPFLRRCLYVRLKFPDNQADLHAIVRKNTQLDEAALNQQVLEAAISAFRGVRSAALAGQLQKPPSTSELIDWVKILYWRGMTAEQVAESPGFPPYWELLFKTMPDLEQYPSVAPRSEGAR